MGLLDKHTALELLSPTVYCLDLCQHAGHTFPLITQELGIIFVFFPQAQAQNEWEWAAVSAAALAMKKNIFSLHGNSSLGAAYTEPGGRFRAHGGGTESQWNVKQEAGSRWSVNRTRAGITTAQREAITHFFRLSLSLDGSSLPSTCRPHRAGAVGAHRAPAPHCPRGGHPGSARVHGKDSSLPAACRLPWGFFGTSVCQEVKLEQWGHQRCVTSSLPSCTWGSLYSPLAC